MNQKPLRPCNKPGCSNLTRDGYCEQHKKTVNKIRKDTNRFYDKYKRNKKHDRFYHSVAWKKVKEIVKIRDMGLCRRCFENKRLVPGTIVDHIIPLSIDWEKRLDEDNLQLLCIECHNAKTAEDKRKYGKI